MLIFECNAGFFSKEFLNTLSKAAEVKFIEEDGYVQHAITIQFVMHSFHVLIWLVLFHCVRVDAPWGLNRLSAAAENVQTNNGTIEGKAIKYVVFPLCHSWAGE